MKHKKSVFASQSPQTKSDVMRGVNRGLDGYFSKVNEFKQQIAMLAEEKDAISLELKDLRNERSVAIQDSYKRIDDKMVELNEKIFAFRKEEETHRYEVDSLKTTLQKQIDDNVEKARYLRIRENHLDLRETELDEQFNSLNKNSVVLDERNSDIIDSENKLKNAIKLEQDRVIILDKREDNLANTKDALSRDKQAIKDQQEKNTQKEKELNDIEISVNNDRVLVSEGLASLSGKEEDVKDREQQILVDSDNLKNWKKELDELSDVLNIQNRNITVETRKLNDRERALRKAEKAFNERG